MTVVSNEQILNERSQMNMVSNDLVSIVMEPKDQPSCRRSAGQSPNYEVLHFEDAQQRHECKLSQFSVNRFAVAKTHQHM